MMTAPKLTNEDIKQIQKLLERYKKKHDDYWSSRRLIQRSIDDWIDEESSGYIDKSFRLMPKRDL